MTLNEILEKNRRIYPNEVALIELRPTANIRQAVTWKEFDDRSNKIANALHNFGIREGNKVLHWQKNSINWFETCFGIIKTGAWVVPLNYRFTSEDFRYCADITEAQVVIVDDELLERVVERSDGQDLIKIVVGQSQHKRIESLEDVIERSSGEPLDIEISEEDGCALYFTSGTTGEPKPILHSHRGLEWMGVIGVSNFRVSFKDNFMVIPPLYHLGAFGHWMAYFSVGARAVILPEFTPKNLFEAVSQELVTTTALLVPWTQDILNALDKGELKKDQYDLSSWRLMYMGAQHIPPSIIGHWKGYFPGMAYDTDYGTSEAGFAMHLDMENEHKIGSIGKPAIGWDSRIVDGSGNEVPNGEVGELVVKGNATMKEYYKNPRKTKETVKAGWVFTGDLAKKDEDGFVYIAGRKKDVVISGGENIYPEEIENVLQNLAQVKDVAVIGLPDRRLGEIVTAVVKVKAGESLSEDEVAGFCANNLPRYKRPRRIIFAEIPRNQAGKIEKAKLREKFG
jgi:acyl-CoA synthetase (AMP-forming)/AMP-acid ligase II